MNARRRAFGLLVSLLGAVCAAPCLGTVWMASLFGPMENIVWFGPTSLAFFAYFGVIGYKVWIGWRWFDPYSTRCVQPTPDGWRVRLEPSVRWLVWLVGVLTLALCVCVVGLFALGNPLTPPPWEVAVVMWFVGLIPIAIMCWRTPPDRWLEVDEQAKELRWIHCRTRERFVIPFHQILGIRVTDAEQMKLVAWMRCWFVSIRWRDDRWPQITELSRWMELSVTLNPQAAESAYALADWLYERLGLGNEPRKARLVDAE